MKSTKPIKYNDPWADMPDLTPPEPTIRIFNMRLTATDIENVNIIKKALKTTTNAAAVRSAIDNYATYLRRIVRK